MGIDSWYRQLVASSWLEAQYPHSTQAGVTPGQVLGSAIEQLTLSLVVLAQRICTFDVRVRRMRREEEVRILQLDLEYYRLECERYRLECAALHLQQVVDRGVVTYDFHSDVALPKALPPVLDYAKDVNEGSTDVGRHLQAHPVGKASLNGILDCAPCWCGSGRKLYRCHGVMVSID